MDLLVHDIVVDNFVVEPVVVVGIVVEPVVVDNFVAVVEQVAPVLI